jgi:hypothetical protein
VLEDRDGTQLQPLEVLGQVRLEMYCNLKGLPVGVVLAAA